MISGEGEEMDQLLSILRSLPLFQGFSQRKLEELVKKSHVKDFAPREVIIKFGQPGRFLGIMLEGEAEAVITGKTGERIRLGLLNKGNILGEASLLTGEPTNADVIALTKCELLLIPQVLFSSFLAVNADAVRIMAKTITERLRARQRNEEEQNRVEDAWRDIPDPYGLRLTTAMPEKVLVINCGSSSLKFRYYDTEDESRNSSGAIERIGLDNSFLTSESKTVKVRKALGKTGYKEAFQAVVNLLTDEKDGMIKDLGELSVVGHRVVHGGDKYDHSVIIDEEVVQNIESYSRLAPLHNPANLMAILESRDLMRNVPQVAVFDTGFHQKMPAHAFLYGLPYGFYEDDGIRRYGFHGISHHYVSLQAAAHLKRDFRELKIITCHLGNGASICAIDHGRSVDTSMGLTPLEGLIMGTRSGDLDPSAVVYLSRAKGLSLEEIEEILNRQSGLKGLSGVSSDLREIEEEASRGNQKALAAIDVFCYRLRKYIGAYMAAIGGLDALVFTGGIGQGSAWVRGLACQGLSHMGICVDTIRNKTASPGHAEVAEISDEYSQVKVLVIPTDEERMIAREAIRTLGYQDVTRVLEIQKEKKIPIEISAPHTHLTKEAMEALFGTALVSSWAAGPSQPGHGPAFGGTVGLIGPKGRIDNVRILGPLRDQAQVEISKTEEFKLGIKAPIRASGDLEGTPGITLEGPHGSFSIKQGVICPQRHVHMSPEDALSFGLKDRDLVMVKVEGERPLVFGDVLVRIHPDYRLSMHIDSDEANAASLKTGMEGTFVGVQDRR
jgi:acetate kinase